LKDNIGFLQMSEVVERCLEKVTYVSKPTFEDYVETDRETRQLAGELVAMKQFSN
jgi:1-deoxy-D-xylulose-5-phosphate reductoisomerase